MIYCLNPKKLVVSSVYSVHACRSKSWLHVNVCQRADSTSCRICWRFQPGISKWKCLQPTHLAIYSPQIRASTRMLAHDIQPSNISLPDQLPCLVLAAVSSTYNDTTLRRAFVVYKNDKLHRGHGALISPATILSATLAGSDGEVLAISEVTNLVTFKYPNQVNDWESSKTELHHVIIIMLLLLCYHIVTSVVLLLAGEILFSVIHFLNRWRQNSAINVTSSQHWVPLYNFRPHE